MIEPAMTAEQWAEWDKLKETIASGGGPFAVARHNDLLYQNSAHKITWADVDGLLKAAGCKCPDCVNHVNNTANKLASLLRPR